MRIGTGVEENRRERVNVMLGIGEMGLILCWRERRRNRGERNVLALGSTAS